MSIRFLSSQPSGWPVVGHERAVSMLKRSIQKDLLSHAYLFTGVEGTGKRTLALALAMTLNCQAASPAEGSLWPVAPCGFCSSCSRILRGEHPDVTEINLETQAAMLEDAGKGRGTSQKELRVESIRDMQRTVGLSPHSGRWKVYIIGDADKMNEEAANCLLKTLEEPPAHTMLLLLASDESGLLPTIYSRCIHVPLRPLSRKVIADALISEWHADPEKANQLAALSGGRLGWAVKMLDQRGRMESRSQALEDLALLSNASILDRISAATKFAKKFTEARPELYATLDYWESWWRDLLAIKVGTPEIVLNVDQLPALSSVASRILLEQAYRAIELVIQTRRQLQENVNPRLALEALAVGLP